MTEVYPSALSYLYQPTPELERFAQSYFDAWNSKTGDYRSATISVVRTEYLEELALLARAAFLRWKPTLRQSVLYNVSTVTNGISFSILKKHC